MLQFKIDNNMELYPRERVDKLAIRMAKKEGLTEAEIYRVIDAVRYYYATLYPEKRPILVEADFKVVRGGITITGRLDEADEDGWIVDHKFSYDIWAEPRAKYGYQPIIYQWAGIDQIERARPGWVFRGFEYNIIRLFPHPMIQRIRIPRMNQEKSDWWENELFEMAKCMRRDYYPANPSEKACAFCFHKELCKPAIYKVEISKLGDQDDPNDAEDL
jgi:MoaA/NifB/PqqE/SkfB family radical SAM enzyme